MRDIPAHFEAVLSGLQFCQPSRELLRTLNDSEWNDLLSRWEILRLMVPLKDVCGEDLPEWVRSRIDQNLADNAQRFEYIKLAYLNFTDALRRIGAEHLVIKGFAQWPGFVEHPRLRFQSDIDVYCPPGSIPLAREALCSLGYVPARGLNFGLADHLPTMVLKTGWKWRGNHYDPEMPVSFELHFCFWNENLTRLRPKGLEQFWSRRIDRRLENISFPTLNDVDNLGYTALNLTRDLLRDGASSYQVYELARFLHANSDNDQLWRVWRSSHDDLLRRLEAISFRMASHCFACRLPKAVESEIGDLPIGVRVWFDKVADFSLGSQFRPNKNGVWLNLSLLESSREGRSVLFKRLFPTRIPPFEAPYIHDTLRDGQQSVGTFRKRVRYVAYLSSRIQFHMRIVPSTLWHGIRLWWSTKELGRNFLTFLAVSFLFTFGMYIFFFLYNLYLLDCGLRENFLGRMTSAMTIGSVAGTVPAGILAQHLGLRKTLIVCVTLVSLVSALRSLFVSETTLLVLAFVAGLVSVIWAVVLLPTIAQVTNEKSRAFGFSVVVFFGIAVGILGGQAGGRLPGWLMHMNPSATTARAKEVALLLACGIVALASAPASRLRVESKPIPESKIYPRSPFLGRYLIAIAVWSLAIGAFSPFLNVYFSRYLHVPLKQMGMIFSISYIPQLLAILIAPVLFRRFGLVTGIIWTQIATAVALGGLATVSGRSAATMIFMGYVAFQWMSEPGIFSLLMNQVPPTQRTGASALNFLVVNASQAVAAVLAGSSFVRFGYPVVLSVTATVALSAAALFRLLLGKDPLRSSQIPPDGLYGD